MSRKQLPLLSRDQLGYYSRAEMMLVLTLLVLESLGHKGATTRALTAFWGNTGHAVYRTVKMAVGNELVSIGHNGKSQTVALTDKGKGLINGAVKRVTGTKRFVGEVHGRR